MPKLSFDLRASAAHQWRVYLYSADKTPASCLATSQLDAYRTALDHLRRSDGYGVEVTSFHYLDRAFGFGGWQSREQGLFHFPNLIAELEAAGGAR